MRTNKTVSHIYYELDHDVQEYAKRLLAKKILHAAQQDNAVPFSDETAKRIAETAVFLTERLTLLYEVSSGFRGIRFSDSGKQLSLRQHLDCICPRELRNRGQRPKHKI